MNKSRLIYLGIAITIVVLLWGWLVVAINKQNRQILDYKKQAQKADVEKNTLDGLQKKLTKNNLTVDDILNSIPDNENFLSLINTIEQIGTVNQVSVVFDFNDLSKKGTKKSTTELKKVDKIDFSLELNGEQTNINNTIKEIEKSQFFIDIQKINYIFLSDDGKQVNVKLQGVIYVASNFQK